MDSDELTYFIVWPWNCEPIVAIHTIKTNCHKYSCC